MAGIVKASTSANIAFEISGQIKELLVTVGDQVDKGQVLASLDPETSQLALQSAKGELQAAQAQLSDAQKKFEQQDKLYSRGYATKTAYDTATANVQSARSAVTIAQSAVKIAERNLSKTDLKAPFAGRVGEKTAEVFEEVAAGQTILTLNSEGEDEVEVSMPETLINFVSLGGQAEIAFPTLQGASAAGTISEIGRQAGQGNAFPITLRLTGQPESVLPGMSAEVTFHFEAPESNRGYSVPMSAVQIAAGEDGGTIFVFDQNQGVVRQRSVKVVNIRDNILQIQGEIEPGEILATAGIPFLADEMKVTLWTPQF